MTYEEQAEERTDKEIAERLASVYGRTGDSLTNEILRTGYYEACMFFLPKIREAVEALEKSHQELRSAKNYVPPNTVDWIEQAQQQVEVSLASLRGVLTAKT